MRRRQEKTRRVGEGAGSFFHDGGDHYASFRPTYPEALATSLAALTTNTGFAMDVGCGNGQLTAMLASHFDTVVGIDPSLSQLRHAKTIENVEYRQQTAENIDVPVGSVDLIVAAQAAHWFDLNAFYERVDRVANSDAIVALVSYGVPQLSGSVNTTFEQGYWRDIHEYWPRERCHVETGYANLPFPFEQIDVPMMNIRKTVTLEQFIGYMQTWSAYKEANARGQIERFHEFFAQLGLAWVADTTNSVVWPITVRAGRVNN